MISSRFLVLSFTIIFEPHVSNSVITIYHILYKRKHSKHFPFSCCFAIYIVYLFEQQKKYASSHMTHIFIFLNYKALKFILFAWHVVYFAFKCKFVYIRVRIGCGSSHINKKKRKGFFLIRLYLLCIEL